MKSAAAWHYFFFDVGFVVLLVSLGATEIPYACGRVRGGQDFLRGNAHLAAPDVLTSLGTTLSSRAAGNSESKIFLPNVFGMPYLRPPDS